MSLPTRLEAEKILEEHVSDTYQKLHARMVASALEGYAKLLGEDPELWYVTGLLHDIDFEKYPDTHPKESLNWFREWSYPDQLIQAVEAHAYGYNRFSVLPKSKLDFALMACDEICGIFYAYKKLNPLPYKEMKVKSIKKRLGEKSFAPKIERRTVYMGCDGLGIDIDSHIENLTKFLPEGS